MEKDLVLTADAANLLYGLDNADFIVDGHDGDQRSVWSNGPLQVFQIDQPTLFDGEVGHVKALLLQYTATVKHTREEGVSR